MTEESIIISVELSESDFVQRAAAVKAKIDELKQANKTLQQAVKEGTLTDAEAGAQFEKNSAAIKNLQGTYNSYQKTIQATTKDNAVLDDSLNGMRRTLTQLQNEYASLSKSEREADDVGGKLLRQIQDQKDAVSEAEQAMGDYRRNVGNYQSGITQLLPFMDKFDGALGKIGLSIDSLSKNGIRAFAGLGTAVKSFTASLLSNPITLILTAIAAAVAVLVKGIGQITEQFKRNEQAGTSWAKMMAVFQPMLDGLRDTLNKIVTGLGRAAEAVATFFGAISKDVKDAQLLIQAEKDLEKAERDYVVSSAKNTAEIEKLKTESRNREKYDYEERLGMLERAAELEKQNAEERVRIENERVRIMIEKADKEKDTRKETMDAIANARAAASRAEQEYYTRVREVNENINTFRNEEKARIKAEADAVKKAADEKAKAEAQSLKEREEAAREYASRMREIDQQIEDVAIELMRDGVEKQIELRRLQGERELEDLRNRTTETAAERDALNTLIALKEQELQRDIEQIRQNADEENVKNAIAAEQKRIDLLLSAAVEGTNQYYELRRQALQNAMDEELLATSLSEEEKLAVQQKYAGLFEDLQREQYQKQAEQRELALQNELAEKQLAFEMGMTTATEQAEAELEFERSRLENIKREQFETEEEYNAAIIDSKRRVEQAEKNVELAQVESVESFANAMSAVSNLTSTILSSMDKESKQYAIAQKALAIFNIGVSAATAIAGVARAAANSKNVFSMIASIVSGVAAVTSTIVQAKKILSDTPQGFATGGIVGGTSYTGDNVSARVNSGEMILTRQQQTQLFDIANGIQPAQANAIDYDALASAMAAQPAPVMDYREFTNFQEKVVTYNELSRI